MARVGSIGSAAVAFLCSLPMLAASDSPAVTWATLQPGIEYAAIDIESPPRAAKKLQVVRVDPAKAHLTSLLASQHGRMPRTARQWSLDFNLAVAMNLGMYQADHLSNVGYLRNGDHLNNAHWATSHKSAFAFSPKIGGLASAVMVDLDTPGSSDRLAGYETVVQNLRLIKAPGENVWTQQPRQWSEAALAMDADGRFLFIFCRAPLSMWELNQRLLSLPLRIVRAMHMEGGPEASLSIHAGGVNLDLSGSFETGFNPNDNNSVQWSIPNVLGVVKAQ